MTRNTKGRKELVSLAHTFIGSGGGVVHLRAIFQKALLKLDGAFSDVVGQARQIALFLGAERRGEMSREFSSAFQMLLDALGPSIWGLVSEIGGRFVHGSYASLCVILGGVRIS